MIVPEYWAEGRVQGHHQGKPVTVRRFGWSDTSQTDAQMNADARAQDALQRLLAGEKLKKYERKIAYNGGQGIPIREEVLERHGAAVITRNAYGARCLNTDKVFFADIDFSDRPNLSTAGRILYVIFVLLTIIYALLTNSVRLGLALTLLAFICAATLPFILHRFRYGDKQTQSNKARARIYEFVRKNPIWNLRVYETPAGLRVIATHSIYTTDDQEVKQCFAFLQVDPLYAQMCVNQHCFRARLSAKPWRIGIATRLRPRPGVWPVSQEWIPGRRAWISKYEAAAKSYSACRFLESIGSGVIAPDVAPVLALHDDHSGAMSHLPCA